MKQKNRLGALALAIVLCAAPLIGCGAAQSDAAGAASSSGSDKTEENAAAAAEPVRINLWSYGSDNVRIAWEAILEGFHAKNADIEAELQFLPSGTGGQTLPEKFIAAVKSGKENIEFDVIEMSDNDLVQITGEVGYEALRPLSEKDIPAMAAIPEQSQLSQGRATVFRGNTVLLAYNSETVAQPPRTYDELIQWIKDHPGRFAYNDPLTGGAGLAFLITSIYNPLPEEALNSSDEKWKAEWEQGMDLLKEIHPYLYKASGHVQYPAKNQGTLDLLAAGSIDIAPAWADMALDQLARGQLPKNIKIAQITPPLTGGMISLGIPAASDDSKFEAACRLIDYIDSPEGQEILVKSQKIIPIIDSASLSAEANELLNGFKSDTYRVYSIGKLNTELQERWQREIAILN
ncbi:MAG: extracellular solute-binding protein [Clostridiales Family XIII bacterium]|jgi:putative spermidine/putrescine transport system substrate-binding protein|nr:extracellular solute-binding protein [Clostridiales Family XIII bacterium]